MNVKEIVKEYLLNNGYDGLCNDDCGCCLDDLMPCEGDIGSCEPGYKKPCNCDDGCDFHMSKKKYDFCYQYCKDFVEEHCYYKCLSESYDIGNREILTCTFFKPKESIK
jgi:hypothetical protein